MLEDDVRELKTLVIGLGGRLDGIEAKLVGHDQRFDEIDRRFDAHDRRFDDHDRRFDDLDRRFADHDRLLEDHGRQLEDHGRLLENHGHQLEKLGTDTREEFARTGEYVDLKFGQLQTEMRKGFAAVDAEFARTRQLITSQFVKAAEHADRLFAVRLRKRASRRRRR